jgi:acyl-CoA synthetase (AMP-forming)/AMP-acid ligase II
LVSAARVASPRASDPALPGKASCHGCAHCLDRRPGPPAFGGGPAPPSAARYLGKLAVVAGDLRVSYAEFDAAAPPRLRHHRPVQPAQGILRRVAHRSPHAALRYFNDHAALRYFNDEEKTAEAFRGGWFHSGDLGVMTEDGYLSVVDRKKDMIKTGGENVASREVEEAIYELDGVAEVAVFGISHPHWVEAVTAVAVPKDGVSVTAEDIHAHLRSRLAGYKRPKYVVLADALPKNSSGKILKRELRQQHADLATRA